MQIVRFMSGGKEYLGRQVDAATAFRIDGRFEGVIPSGSELILGDTAEVDADIRVERLSINGILRGTVRASERVEIHPRARVQAELHTPVLRIEEGAFFQGSCDMGAEPAAKVVDLQAQRK